MTKLTLALVPILALSLLLSLSNSLSSADLNGRDPLLLPSDNPHPVPDETDSPATVADPKSAIASVPLTKLDFHEGGIPLSFRFPHRRGFGRGFRHGFMRHHQMRPRDIPYGNDMILSGKMNRPEEFLGRSSFHWVNRRPRFEVDAPWKGEEEGMFKRPEMFERGYDEEEGMLKRPENFERGYDEEEGMFKRPENFEHHDEDEGGFKQPKKFDHDEDSRMFERVEKVKHVDDDHMFRMPGKFKHDDEDWHWEKHHQHHFGRHHHKHHHDDDEDDEARKHGKHHHQEEEEDDDDEEGGTLSRMRKFFDDLF